MNLILLTLLSVASFGVNGRVEVDVEKLSPVINTINPDEKVLRNSQVVVELKCSSAFPVEWTFNHDRNTKNVFRREWTERKIKNARQGITYEFVARMKLQFPRITTPQILKCGPMDTEQEKEVLVIQLLPNENDTVNIITRYELSLETNQPTDLICELRLNFMQVGTAYFIQCAKVDDDKMFGVTTNHECEWSAAYCANTFRDLKSMRNICPEKSIGQKEPRGRGWTELKISSGKNTLIPGVLICAAGNFVGAQEYFFTAPNQATEKREIHFVWNKIKPEDMIWITPSQANRTYYIGESISGVCTIPKYGFSFDPVFVVKENSKTLPHDQRFESDYEMETWKKSFNIIFRTNGSYEVNCHAPVWNSNEWAGQSLKISVRERIPPRFDEPVEFKTLKEGENQEVVCVAIGDPTPEVEWVNDTISAGVTVNGSTLIFTSTEFIEAEYTCKILSNYSEYPDKKKFMISRKNESGFKGAGNNQSTAESKADSNIPILTITVGVSISVLTMVFFGILYFYIKYTRLNKIMDGLTMEEISEFRNGKTKKVGEKQTSANFMESLSYNNSYELSTRNFHVDTTQSLGSGEFGIVCKGTVTTDQGIMEVAFKTVKKKADKNYIKALLAELKILIYLGKHKSIITLIGGWTENLENGEVLLAVELCESSLLSFVQNNSSGFLNCVQGEVLAYELTLTPTVYRCIEGSKEFSTFNLIQWAKEISGGLDFISRKHIVHADIAARNILLTSRFTTKICDFGLARQLVDYSYIKSERCPLPWKWMAIECLEKMHFSTKSDVWAFGITLWEIFTLGNVPYPGWSYPTTNFVVELEKGLRLPQPPNAPKEIWELMMDCWQLKPEDRPTFPRLKECFKKLRISSDRSSNSVSV